jgi:hypothetical protein
LVLLQLLVGVFVRFRAASSMHQATVDIIFLKVDKSRD